MAACPACGADDLLQLSKSPSREPFTLVLEGTHGTEKCDIDAAQLDTLR
jgi:hypothetical protein